MVVERGRGFKSDLQSHEASLGHLSPLLEIVRFTSLLSGQKLNKINWLATGSDSVS